MKKLLCGVFATVIFSFLGSIAYAVNFAGQITVLEPTYLPAKITFQMDTGGGACPAGTWITWSSPDTHNIMAVYSTLLAALMSGKTIALVVDDGDQSCPGKYLHIYPQ